jgi:DNA-directed RNA polymerase III subunit RPC8
LLIFYSNDLEQVFTWVTDDATLYFDSHETVRIRVEEETWHDQAPTKATGGENEQDMEVENNKQAPYGITASMEESGLGPCLWWDGDDEDEEA